MHDRCVSIVATTGRLLIDVAREIIAGRPIRSDQGPPDLRAVLVIRPGDGVRRAELIIRPMAQG